MAASGRSEAEAKALFDGGVKLEIPFTTKIDSDFEPLVKELKQAVPGGNMKTRGYRATFRFFPGGRLHASKAAGFLRGRKKYIKLPVYSTFAEADGRKYRDAVAYAESNFRAPKPVPDDQRQRQARDARHDARVLSNDPTEARRRKEQQDQEATAAAGDAMKQQYKRKSTLRDPAPEKEEDPKAKQKRVDAVEQAAFGLPASVYSPPPKNAAERHHRAAIKKRLAQGSEAMDTLNNQIEALVAANQKLTDKKLDVTATTFGASGGGAEGGDGGGGGGGGGGAGSGPAHDGSSDAGDAQDADEAERTAAAQRKADALAELAFAALSDHQVDNLHLQIVSVMVVTRHFYAAWKTYCERVEHTPLGTPIERVPNVARAISKAQAEWAHDAARLVSEDCPGSTRLRGWFQHWLVHKSFKLPAPTTKAPSW